MANHVLRTKCGPLIDSVNKVLLEHRRTHVYILSLGLLSGTGTELVVLTVIMWLTMPKLFALWSFTEQSFLSPDLEESASLL